MLKVAVSCRRSADDVGRARSAKRIVGRTGRRLRGAFAGRIITVSFGRVVQPIVRSSSCPSTYQPSGEAVGAAGAELSSGASSSGIASGVKE